ncbi:DEAD/DEAH box helicase family protein [Muricauda sp. HICW]|uniref:DEAD/DEAH box helicase family protein n=1 Tax=Flagellimonas chongwuensis TaxID=2697365 RepID=A0A850NAH8_9FLAO|nr:DEAD/DEAH box helicase family protein [Allomuricauda chongwuensis]NVN18231.1 DEAD/DEAH box helicase family protein [Allomuricauda chongwuensis]
MTQKTLDLPYEIQLQTTDAIYYRHEKRKIGVMSQLAFEKAKRSFNAIHDKDDSFNITHEGISFKAELEKGRGKNKRKYKIKGCVKSSIGDYKERYHQVNINGVGDSGFELRPAQKGAIYALLSHWSVSDEISTIVLPTGTGKTETMLVTTLADKAQRTLVIVPTVELKLQIAEKFENWGILRKLGVIPKDFPNPTTIILNKTISDEGSISFLESADVIVSTPALIARAPKEVKEKLKNIITHVFFDEAHHVTASEWEEIKILLNKSKVVQFTATPYRNDRKPIEGKMVYNYPLSKALEDECFSKISLVTVDERHPKKKDKAIADAAMARLKQDREKGWKDHCMMVRAEKKLPAEKLYHSYKKWFPDEKIVLIHSNTKGRKQIIEQIKKREFDIIVCVGMLKEGFDFPEFKIAAVHGIHKSLSVLLQFIGRFTRPKEGLGDASFVVNYAEEKMSVELENLFQEGSGWEKVISEIADAKKAEAESLLAFLQGCKPFSGFDSPDIELNPRLVYPALSCMSYRCKKVDWALFKNAFNLKKYALSQPYINQEENIFYFTTQKREKVKWARTDALKDQTWNLVVLHHDTKTEMLYVGYSEKRMDVDYLVEKITKAEPNLLKGDCVFRSFDSIKRLSIVHAGIFKPANQLHRYSRLSGADVTTELSRWQEGKRSKKSDFVGIGFRDGEPVSVGASVKGKLWSPARIGDLKEWKSWCLNMGRLITDENIDSNQLLVDSAKKIQLETFPEGIIILATDWAEELYSRIHKLTIQKTHSHSFLLSECTLTTQKCEAQKADFKLILYNEEITFSIILGGENGFTVHGLDNSTYSIEGLKMEPMPLKKFFEENPPTMFLLNGCTISGCIHTDYGDSLYDKIPEDRIEVLKWENVNYRIESLYKSGVKRENSIQEYMMNTLVNRGAKVVFNDDNSGEKADVIAVFSNEDVIRFELIHCKYSKEKSGARISDLYEVCGQAIVSLRYKWKPEELLKHMERRDGMGVLREKRFFHGSLQEIEKIRKALKYTDVVFEFAIAQPGVERKNLSNDMIDFLGSVYSTIAEMTETKLKCYFNT